LFTGGDDRESPESDLVQGANGTIYGTSLYGSNGNDGTVFEIMPSGGAYAFQVIYNFSGAVQGRLAGDIVLHNGSIYGVTVSGPGSSQGGTVFKLAQSGGAWTSTLIYTFDVNNPSAGWDPIGNIIFDSKGNIYGATYAGGATCGYLGGCGTIWELTRTQSGAYTETVLHAFQAKDGHYPEGVVLAGGRFMALRTKAGRAPVAKRDAGRCFLLVRSLEGNARD
jgi:hypothetical protein